MDFGSYIRSIPDFPKPGILFRDITPLLQDSKAFDAAVDALCEPYRGDSIQGIAAAEARGFLFAAPMAIRMGVPMIPVRKPGKLPGKIRSARYDLEYGNDQLEILHDAVHAGQRILVVDDLLATGGTVAACCSLLGECEATVVGCAFLIELAGLGGRKRLETHNIHAVLTYDEGR